MPSPVQSKVVHAVRDDIESMRTRGAGEIGKQAANALAKAAEAFEGDDIGRLREELVEAARLLAAARPTAVSLRNSLNRILSAAFTNDEVAGACDAVKTAAAEFAKRVDAARAKIADLGQSYLENGDVVLTHCHSTVAGAVIARAVEAGKGLTIFATETRPFRQGFITTRLLADRGVKSTLIVDSAVQHVMRTKDVTKVVVGADTVAADGSLYNKVGTSTVALLANVLDIPFYVACESYKFSPYTLDGEEVPIEERDAREVAGKEELAQGVSIFNPVFDRTPPEMITSYLTEDGPVEPGKVREYVERTFKGVKRWV